MYKRYFKKVICFSLLFISLFTFTLEVLAAKSMEYTFKGDGTVISLESDNKLTTGKVYLSASRGMGTYLYNGVFRFVLYKKGIFGYSEYDREMQNTYKNTNLVMSRGNMSKAYYKGTLQLYAADTSGSWSGITTKFEIGQIS